MGLITCGMVVVLHSELYSPELDYRVDNIDDPFKDTFSWVFDLPIFSKWLQEGSGLFWIHGKPGSGKSTLMKLIFQSHQTWELLHNWRRGSLEIMAGFFFHYRGSVIQKSFEGVLRSLILQILAPLHTPYLKRHRATWEKFECERKQLIEQKNKLSNVQRLLSFTTRALEVVRGDMLHLRQARLDVQDPPVTPERRKLIEEARQKSLQDAKAREEYLLAEESSYRSERNKAADQIGSISSRLVAMEKHHRPYQAAPETRVLKALATAFRNSMDHDELIPKLERLLQQLLEQNMISMDVVLFFDALDEFDGHLDMIGRFVKALLHSSVSSKTRVKVCISSRPWEILKAHFSSLPGFAMQDHTTHDIQEYAVGSIAISPGINTSILRLVPTILGRANGVFLWVKLAIRVLLETAALTLESTPLDVLEKRLEELPDDLFEFYEMIVERISKRNRRRTFALLELLIRHIGPPLEARQIRDAALLLDCRTFSEAIEILETTAQLANLDPEPHDKSIRDDIHTWSGGLVEIKVQNGIARPQLMHQTVLEFAMGLWFKGMVVGDLASILHENGHSFHAKYWIVSAALKGDGHNVVLVGMAQTNSLRTWNRLVFTPNSNREDHGSHCTHFQILLCFLRAKRTPR